MSEVLAGYAYEYVPRQGPRTLLLLHGTGGSERDLIPLGTELDPNANLLSPRGNVSENGMARFFARHAEGVFDRNDLTKRTEELQMFVKAAKTKHEFDPAQLVGVGFSNGANILLHLLVTHPELFNAALLFRPMSRALPDEVGPVNLPVYIGAGKNDTMVPEGDTDHLASVLKHAGASVELHYTENGHGLSRADIDPARTWLASL